MPYTAAQLTQYYVTVNRGAQPDGPTTANIAAAANSNAAGQITDFQALQIAIATPQTRATSDVAEITYAFFTGTTPNSAGVDYLVNGAGNGYNTTYYNGSTGTATAPSGGGFNTENRYYNAAINLAANSAGPGNAAFVSTYGSLTLQQTVTTAYNAIVGASAPGAAAGIAAITSSIPYFQSVAAARAPNIGADIATKAIIVGYILEEAVKADVGVYAKALDQLNANIALGTATYGSNLLTTYGAGASGFNPAFGAIADGQTFAGPTTDAATINTIGVAAAGSGTINTSSNATITFTNDIATNNGQLFVNVANAATNAADVLNLTYNGQTTSVPASVVAAGVETVNVTASAGPGALAGSTLSLDLQDSSLTTITFRGTESVAYSAPTYAFFDRTTGATTTSVGALRTVSSGGNTAPSNLDVSSAGTATQGITLTGGTAADTLSFKSFATVSGGGGNDTFAIAAPVSVAGISSVTDDHAGNIAAFGAKATSFNAVVTTPASVQAGLDAAANGAAGRASYFTFGGDTYLVLDASAATTFQVGTDFAVRLVGIHNLATSTINAQGAIVLGG